MFKRLARRPTPAMLVAIVALFAATAGVSYAATQGPPSFTSHGVAFVPTSAISGVALPISGTNSSDLSNHGMTVTSSTSVRVPTTGNYLITLAGNCNGGATNTHLLVRERFNLAAGRVDLAIGFEGNPSMAGSNTVHLVAGTTLRMIAGHGGADTNCGATLGVNLLSAD
ncbi:MAG TPA: hypothetical protein VI300_11915 [Solirubrobacter sp.]